MYTLFLFEKLYIQSSFVGKIYMYNLLYSLRPKI
jgi:hypothetical protein